MREYAGFFAVAEALPDRAALVDPLRDAVTYGDLWARMNRAARGLAALGVGPGDTVAMGWQPDEGGHWLLVERLGVKRPLDFLMRKRMVSGEEACALGLVNEVVDDDALLDRSLELATELANGPQVAMRLLKRAVYNAAHLTFDQAGEDIAARTAISDFHQDAIDGAPAFREKRAAAFNQWLEE